MENPTCLGDAVYAFYDGQGIELRLNDHRSERSVYLEPEVFAALSRFHASMTSQEAPAVSDSADDPKNKAVADVLDYCRLEAASKLKAFERCSGIMKRLPEHIIPNCFVINCDLIIYNCTREDVKAIMSSLNAGKWSKNVNCHTPGKLNYNCEVDGIRVQLWGAAPPESCQIIEETVEVPAHTEIKRTLVCK